MTVIGRFIQAVSHGGAMRPTLQVVHSAETPLRAGYAYSIAKNWFGASASTSAHFMVDPVEIIRMLSDNVVAYAVGPAANGFTLNWEQAGYARFSRAEWTTADGMAQMRLLGAGIRERGLANGIPLRWATDQQIRDAARGIPGGICTHDDIRRVLGGTTHTDPMPNYPRDLLQQAWGDNPEDDMDAEQSRKLDYLYNHMTPGTAGVKRHGKGFEALISGSLSAGRAGEWPATWGYNTLKALTAQVAGLQTAFDKLADAVATGDGLDATELKAAVREVMAEVVRVEVSVESPAGSGT